MSTLYLVSVWLHVLAATAWLGGMFFLMLVVLPWLRRGDRATAAKLLAETGVRYRAVGWACFAVVLVTGTFNLWVRGVRLHDFASGEWLASSFGRTVLLKLGAFTAVVAISAVHDFVVGPRAAAELTRAPDSPRAHALRRQASLLGRVTFLLALLLVALGVVVVRGVPW